MKFLNQVHRFHRNRDAGAIIDRACAQIPRIEMTGNDDHLFGMFVAFDVPDDVRALDIRQLPRRQN
jgi:hypothetical protein